MARARATTCALILAAVLPAFAPLHRESFGAQAFVAAPEPSLGEVLKQVAAYVADFQKQLSGIVAEETYEQTVLSERGRTPVFAHRRLKSDLLLVRPVGSDRYVEFRDVFQVDGVAVRDREDRLTKLFLDPPPGARSQLERVVTESARYNIGNIMRTVNTPLLPLGFLAAKYQPQFAFKLSRERNNPAIILEYDEKARPTLVRTPAGENLQSSGRFWIDPATGAVVRSELIVENHEIKATVNVTYRSEPRVGFLVPSEMREKYVARGDRIEGRAQYGRFRKFQVQVDEQIKPVKQ